MTLPSRLLPFALAILSSAAWGEENYLGTLRPPPQSGLASGLYSFTTGPQGIAPRLEGETGYRLKLGYKYSRYLSVEGEYRDVGRMPSDLFIGPGNLASGFRHGGVGIDTIATLPLWDRFSFYGRLGAYRGDARNGFLAYSTSLLGESTGARSTRWRYGLGMRYDITNAFGIRAEMERYSPLGSSLASDAEADLFSVGVMWRF
ncbi:MAG TPA: outer membrane beta-barrel protein [Usitatibacter sp.]|nr:outer membrane beta-barrel protein [Usitatibacter sp.]